ncbi:hypothetical protein DFAR_3850054 [Desulfarculales bacterium]
MVRVASLFSQLLHHFPRTEFAALVKEGAQCRGQDQGSPLLDPVRGHALLSFGQGRFPKGDLPRSFLLPGVDSCFVLIGK